MTFLGIGGRGTQEEIEAFVDRHDLTGFTQLNDEGQSLWNRFGATGRSTFLFLNDDGTFSRTGYGEVSLAVLDERVQELIAS